MGAIGDLAIVNRQTTAAPKDYTVPGAQEVMALAVTAAIDGSGAAGSFLPCLQLLSPAGDVLWTARSASSFSAGQSVDMTWFPRAGGITSATVSSAGLPWLFAVGFPTIPYNGGGTSLIGLDTSTYYTSTGDNSIFETVDNGSGAFIPQINAVGEYRVHLYEQTAGVAGASGKRAYVTFTGAGNPVGGARYAPFLATAGAATFTATPSVVWELSLASGGTAPPHTLPIQVAQDTGADYVAEVVLWIEQVNPTGNPNF